jgi:hypothetical protein
MQGILCRIRKRDANFIVASLKVFNVVSQGVNVSKDLVSQHKIVNFI